MLNTTTEINFSLSVKGINLTIFDGAEYSIKIFFKEFVSVLKIQSLRHSGMLL